MTGDERAAVVEAGLIARAADDLSADCFGCEWLAQPGHRAHIVAAVLAALDAQPGDAERPCIHCGRPRERHSEDREACVKAGYYGNRYEAGDAEQAGGLTDDEREALDECVAEIIAAYISGESSQRVIKDLRSTVERILAARAAAAPGADAVRALEHAWEEGAYAGREYQKRLRDWASPTFIGSAPVHPPNPYREVRAAADTGGES